MNITLTFTPEQMGILNAALVELPFRVAAPLITEINAQIQHAHNLAAEAREEAQQ